MPHRAPGASDGRKGHYLSGKPIKYYRPRGSQDVRALIDDGFQAFNGARLSEACHIFSDKMLDPDNDTTIGITVAGALTPAGLGGCLIELMERGLVDFVISTGANLYHDLHYALNFTLRRGSPFLDDRDLYDEGVIRIYDVLFPATVLLETDAYVRDFLVRCGIDEPISTSELHLRLGQDLLARREGCEDYSVLAAAAKYGVPIYTSSPGDSSIGMNIAYHEFMNNSRLMIDPNKDVNEICAIVLAGHKNGCVILGGGSPKNFYLQAQPTLWEVYGIQKGGNEYFIQFTTDSGGLGRTVGRHAVGSRQLGQGQPRGAARHRGGVRGFDHRVSALLRVRGRRALRPASAAQPRRQAQRAAGDLARRGHRGGRVAAGGGRDRDDRRSGQEDVVDGGIGWERSLRSWRRGPVPRPGPVSMPMPTCRRASSRSCARPCSGTCCLSSNTTTCGARPTGGTSCCRGNWGARW